MPISRLKSLCLALGLLLLAPMALGQIPNGTLRGQVKSADGASLPGVLVTASSPQMQGDRTATTDNNGYFRITGLPPGPYEITYELDGFTTVTKNLKISAAQDTIDTVEMTLATVTESIVVTGSESQISETNTAASTFDQTDIDKLAISRDPADFVNLAPGVHDTGPSTAPSINGAMTFENLFMINGVEVSDNIRGTPLPLFIEDAVQETTVATSGISAEYGRFTGGVINVITKSGGNEFSGSLRANLTNDDWQSREPFKKNDLDVSEPVDKINKQYEATLGGYIVKDRLWFFGSGRDFDLTSSEQTAGPVFLPYQSTDSENRWEGKITLAVTPNHNLVGSYLDYTRERTGTTFNRVLDLQSLTAREDPQEYKVVNYNGVLSEDFFVEALWSEREFQIAKGSGGPTDLINGTLIRPRTDGGSNYWAPYFCGECEQELRNSEDWLAKGSYFLSTESLGSHDLTFGYDTFSDIRFSVNHQTGSDFQVWANRLVIGNDPAKTIYPVFDGPTTWLVWWPPINVDAAQKTDFATDSFYVNDAWQLNDKWSFNLGVRYDKNDGKDSAGNVVTDDSKISPRLGLSWDIRGTGDLVAHASYGSYVAKIANSGNIADGASTAGALAGFGFGYTGPSVNVNCQPSGVGCTPTDAALQTLFDWYFANGGSNDFNDISNLTNLPLIFACIPGSSSIVPEPYKSPSTDEYTIGLVKRLGTHGTLRADLIYREWQDFYSDKTTLETGSVDTPTGAVDVTWKGNFGDRFLERKYRGLNLQGRYRFNDRLTLAGNYTLSELEGNVNGETGGSGPVPTSPLAYPEYSDLSWSLPKGDLSADQRHRLRAWMIYDIIQTDHNVLNVSLLQNFVSGTPYGAVGAVLTDDVTNPGYALPPSTVTYYFTARDAFHTDDITSTDLALNYAFDFNVGSREFEVFLQPEVLNVFDEDGVLSVNTSVLDATVSGGYADFNPFTDTPVEGVNWDKGSSFGQPTVTSSIQTPRTYRFSVGFRF